MSETKEGRSYLAIGQIVGPHGIRGEVKVVSLTDFPERFKAGAKVYLSARTGVTDAIPVNIAAARPHQGRWLVLFSHIGNRNTAETLRDQYVLIPEEDAMPLGEHENYAHDLIGLDVQTADGQPIGQLVEILFTPANDVYIVRSAQAETLIPATREVIQSVDLAGRRMVVVLPEGLLTPVGEDD
jgi:16S rRNA processing protein RimM